MADFEVVSLHHPLFKKSEQKIIQNLQLNWTDIWDNLPYSKRLGKTKEHFQPVPQVPADVYSFVQHLEAIGFTFKELAGSFKKNNTSKVSSSPQKKQDKKITRSSNISELIDEDLDYKIANGLGEISSVFHVLDREMLKKIDPQERPTWEYIGLMRFGSGFNKSDFLDYSNKFKFKEFIHLLGDNNYTIDDLINDLEKTGCGGTAAHLSQIYPST